MGTIRGLAEIVLFVQDKEKSLAFYRDALGLAVISPPDLPAVFLRVGEEGAGVPQQIVLVPRPLGVCAAAATKPERDLHHLAFEVPPGALTVERDRLQRIGYATREGRHPFLPVEAIYLDDPDGNEVELVHRVG